MNKLDELILREYDLKVGDTIQFTEVIYDKTRTAKLEIVEADNVIYCMDHESKTTRTLVDMFNTMNEIRIVKVVKLTKNSKCEDLKCSICPLNDDGTCCAYDSDLSIYKQMKRVVDRFNEVEFVDEVKQDE